jgi:hypothetical protein
MKFGCLIACGVLGGDTTWLLVGVPENVIEIALAQVLCVVFRRARAPLPP